MTKWHPILWLGAITYLLRWVPRLLKLDYDESPIATALFLVNQVVGFLFNLIGFLLSAMNGGEVSKYQEVYVALIGLSLYFLADYLFTRTTGRP